MHIEGALIKEQGITFGILIVKDSVLNSPSQRAEILGTGRQLLGGNPTVLMAQDSRGTPTYFGRPDIVKFLSRVPLTAIPWTKYTVS